RYHARPLRTPTQVRNCLIYVLRNGLKHGSTAFAVDPCSSAAWFEGFAERPPARTDPAPVVAPKTWLLATGWRARGGGPLLPGDTPAEPARRNAVCWRLPSGRSPRWCGGGRTWVERSAAVCSLQPLSSGA